MEARGWRGRAAARRAGAALLCALALATAGARPAPAQEVRRALLGGALGTAGGAAVSFSVVVARARFQRAYIESAGDLVHWQSIPLIAGPAAGVVFALAGEDVLESSVVGAVSGLLVGAGAGALTGALVSREPEWRWAGGVMGGGLGLAVGGMVGALLAWTDPRNGAGGVSVPVTIRVPL